MSLDNLDRIQEIFLDAADLPLDEQSSFLDAACQGDAGLRAQVEAMLASDRKGSDNIAFAVEEEAAALFQAQPLEGVRLGAYRIVREIGRGGMGTVYLATRDDAQFDKQVAIKVVKLGMDTADVLDRFRRERQILANLDHPYIASLLDGGSVPDGRPFFVMEYVPGKTIDAYIEEHKLSIASRCKLFLMVCEAVSYAHRNLVVHRDLKPSNILISSEGVPKLLDFGVSKLLTEHVEGDALTVVARPLTPEYASPEQVRGLPVTTASDVYSLGAVFFELLTGKRAQFLTTKTPAEMERVICQVEVEKPSSLAPEVDTDLDNIVLMAMRKESARRYKSVDEFAEDIRRYLDGRPIIARQDSLGYRVRKFTQRFRLQLTAAALVFLSLLVGVVLALTEERNAAAALQAAEAQQKIAEGERANAERESERAEQARASEARQHLVADQQKDRAVSERAVAEQRLTQLIQLADKTLFGVHTAIEKLPGALNSRKEIIRTTLEYLEQLRQGSVLDDRMRYVLSGAYYKVAEMQGAYGKPNLGDLPGALSNYEKAEEILKPMQSRFAKDSLLLSHWVSVREGRATAQLGMGKRDEALAGYRALLPDAHRLAQLEPDRVDAVMQEPGIYARMYTLLQSQDSVAALAAANENVRLMEQIVKRFPQSVGAGLDLAVGYLQLGVLKMDISVAEGTRYFEQSLTLREDLMKRDPSNVTIMRGSMIAYGNYASLLGSPWTQNIGEFGKARNYYAKATEIARTLVKADPQNATARFDLSMCLMRWGSVEGRPDQDAESLQHLEESLAVLEVLPPAIRNTPGIALQSSFAREYLGRTLTRTKQFDKAEAALRKSLAEAVAVLAKDPRDVTGVTQAMASEQALAEMFSASKDQQHATEFATKAMDRARKQLEANPTLDRYRAHLAKCYLVLAKVHQTFNSPQQAQVAASEALAHWKKITDARALQSNRKQIQETETMARRN